MTKIKEIKNDNKQNNIKKTQIYKEILKSRKKSYINKIVKIIPLYSKLSVIAVA